MIVSSYKAREFNIVKKTKLYESNGDWEFLFVHNGNAETKLTGREKSVRLFHTGINCVIAVMLTGRMDDDDAISVADEISHFASNYIKEPPCSEVEETPAMNIQNNVIRTSLFAYGIIAIVALLISGIFFRP